jgi:hypothetical protein
MDVNKKAPTAIEALPTDSTQAQLDWVTNVSSNDILTPDESKSTDKPTPIKSTFDNIPNDFKVRKHWVLWKYENKIGKWTKVPYQASNKKADSTNPDTWCNYSEAIKAYGTGKYSGIGFAIGDSGFTCVDIDHENEWADGELEKLLSGLHDKYYMEKSPSGNGYHLWLKAVKPEGMGCKSKSFHNSLVEVYNSDRFITMTGVVINGHTSIQKAQAEIESVFAPLMPNPKVLNHTVEPHTPLNLDDKAILDLIISSAGRGTSGAITFCDLHNNGSPDGTDYSGNELAYFNNLAFYTGNNAAQMDRIYRSGAMMRDKWNREDYRQRTLDKAMAGCTTFYDSKHNQSVTFISDVDFNDVSDPNNFIGQLEPEIIHGDVGFDFNKFSLNGDSVAMKAQMLTDTYVLGEIAILGQLTALYAKPGSGKTLLTIYLLIESIKAGNIKAEDVYYINADDNYKGLVHKLELAEKYGFQMIAPGFKDFDTASFGFYLTRLMAKNEARGKVIILDTLKKFTNIMDKKLASDFGKQIRSFVTKGGTVIMLAHTNKNRDADGKVVFSGTSDIVDDVDCAYTLDVNDDKSGSIDKVVLFENIKSRGDVAQEAAYKYAAKVSHYQELLDSVSPVDEGEAQIARERIRMDSLINKNEDLIEIIIELIEGGTILKTELINKAIDQSGDSKAKVRQALKEHTGKKYIDGHRWSEYKGEKSAKMYKVIRCGLGDFMDRGYKETKNGE